MLLIWLIFLSLNFFYREVKLAKATDDLGAYTLLTDQVLQQIMSFPDPNNDLEEVAM